MVQPLCRSPASLLLERSTGRQSRPVAGIAFPRVVLQSTALCLGENGALDELRPAGIVLKVAGCFERCLGTLVEARRDMGSDANVRSIYRLRLLRSDPILALRSSAKDGLVDTLHRGADIDQIDAKEVAIESGSVAASAVSGEVRELATASESAGA